MPLHQLGSGQNRPSLVEFLPHELPDGAQTHKDKNQLFMRAKDGAGTIDSKYRLDTHLQPSGDDEDQCGKIEEPHSSNLGLCIQHIDPCVRPYAPAYIRVL